MKTLLVALALARAAASDNLQRFYDDEVVSGATEASNRDEKAQKSRADLDLKLNKARACWDGICDFALHELDDELHQMWMYQLPEDAAPCSRFADMVIKCTPG